MRFSLVVPLESNHPKVRIRSYEQIEQIALALEIYGWNTIWLQYDSNQDPSQQHILLRSLQLLSNVTDRIDLAAIVYMPSPEQQNRFLEDLKRLDEMSSGRVRIAIRPADHLEASLQFASKVSAVLELDHTAWRARRVQLIAEAEADPVNHMGQARGFGRFISQNTDSNQPILPHYSQTDHQWRSQCLALELDDRHLSQHIEQVSLHQNFSLVDEAICQFQNFPSDNDALISYIQHVAQSVLPLLQQHRLIPNVERSQLIFENILAS
jgi:hypothetical protein